MRMNQVVPGPDTVEAAFTLIEVVTEVVCAGEPLSWTEAVNVVVPVLDGVPEITPVVAAMVKPAGRLPDVMDQV